MTNPIEIYDIGSLGDDDGKLSVSYMPEHNSVILRASVPSDKRRNDIVLRIRGATEIRQVVNQLEATIEIAKRKQIEQESLSVDGEEISLTIMNTKFLIPRKAFERISDLVNAGNNDAVLREIRKEFPLLVDKGISEMAYLIHKQLRPRVVK